MSEQRQRRHRRRDEDEQQAAPPADLRDEELDEDVACCLAEIDEVLDAEQAERDQARREFDKILHRRYAPFYDDDTRTDRNLRIWQAKYAHLGMTYGYCCGKPVLVDEKEDR